MKLVKCAMLVLALALPANLFAGDRLVYAVNHRSSGGGATEVFSVSPDNPQPVLLFSDRSSPVQLSVAGNPGLGIPMPTIVSRNRLFAPGKERALNSSARETGIFEFALDGAGRPRKILDLPPGERVDALIVDGSATRLAYLSLSAYQLTLFIHDVKTGNLLRKLDLTKLEGGCTLRSIRWLPDDKTFFFTLEEGDDDNMGDDDYSHIGNWTMLDDGTLQMRLPASLGRLEIPGYSSNPNGPPILLGIVNGLYLFHPLLRQISRTGELATLLALSDPHGGLSVPIVLQTPPGLSVFALSQNGHYIAYKQQDEPKVVGTAFVIFPVHLWVKPMPIGDGKEVFSLDVGKERDASLTVLGWESD
jgi:hypothetical protein